LGTAERSIVSSETAADAAFIDEMSESVKWNDVEPGSLVARMKATALIREMCGRFGGAEGESREEAETDTEG
jgi:hypothetical protein